MKMEGVASAVGQKLVRMIGKVVWQKGVTTLSQGPESVGVGKVGSSAGRVKRI